MCHYPSLTFRLCCFASHFATSSHFFYGSSMPYFEKHFFINANAIFVRKFSRDLQNFIGVCCLSFRSGQVSQAMLTQQMKWINCSWSKNCRHWLMDRVTTENQCQQRDTGTSDWPASRNLSSWRCWWKKRSVCINCKPLFLWSLVLFPL